MKSDIYNPIGNSYHKKIPGDPHSGGMAGIQGDWGRGVELQETEKEGGKKRSDSHCRGSGGEQNYYNSSHKSEPALHICKVRALIT